MKISNFFIYISLFSYFTSCIRLPLSLNQNNQINDYNSKNIRSLLYKEVSSANDIYNILTIELCIGSPSQCFKLAYDTGNPYLILGVQNTKAQFSKNTTEKYEFEGILGLGNNYPKRDEDNSFDERFSLVHNLYNNGVIKKKLFGHEYTSRKNGYLYLGEIPPSLGYDYYKCSVAPFIPYLNKWHCESRAIALSTGTNYTQFNSPYVFDTSYVDLRGPFYQCNSILSEIKEIFGEKCQYISEEIDEENRYIKLVCDYDIDIGKTPDITFHLKGYELRAKNFDIFRVVLIDGKKKYLSKIVGDTRYNYWNIGEPVLKNYNMVFNYEDNTVGFNENLNLKEGDWGVTIILMIIFIVIGVIGIYVVKNRKKIFNKIKNKDIEKFDKGEMLNSGEQMADMFES